MEVVDVRAPMKSEEPSDLIQHIGRPGGGQESATRSPVGVAAVQSPAGKLVTTRSLQKRTGLPDAMTS